MDGNSTPDLQSILSALAQYTPPVQTSVPPHHDEEDSRSTIVGLRQDGPIQPSQPVVERAEDPRLRPQNRSAAASPKPIDPATITTWQDGLRCVTKIAAQNAQFAVSIRRMIQDQRKHEMRWHSERQAMKMTQANRSSSAAQAQSILRSLGVSAGLTSNSDERKSDNDAELAALDRNIYEGQRELEITMTTELKGLGVPFFGTDLDLVVPDGGEESSTKPVGSQPKSSPIVTETQLLQLRRRMVGHLEDLYRD